MAYALENGNIIASAASSLYGANWAASLAFNTGTSLTGPSESNSWAASGPGAGYVQCQFGAGVVVTRLWVSNFFDTQPDGVTYFPDSNLAGVNGFTLQGSNDGSSWTNLPTSTNALNRHVAANASDGQYVTVSNATSYTYYRLAISGNHGNPYTVGVRRIQLYSGSDAPAPPATYPPTVLTTAISDIEPDEADGGGNVTSDGNGTVSARGVCWNTTGNPTTADSKTTDGNGTGVFSSTLTSLTAPTTYYVRAYATNEFGTGYGNEVSFTTVAPPTVTTNSRATKIKGTSALCRGEIISTGGVDATARGICYNTAGNPTTADSKVEESGTFGVGVFAASLTGLTRATTYFARAYATNTEGTSYGEQISFVTLAVDTANSPEPKLTDTHYRTRAGIYADPLNTGDPLPIVYGDLTDGPVGIWKLPCIDTDTVGGNPVYCFAGHEVLSEANGNSITIYENGQELDSALYTFDEANDFESEGVIATITFTSPKLNAVITAKGKGKPTTSGGATLMENIVDIVEDFLSIHGGFASDIYDETAKARAANVFTAQGYEAAGVIDKDMVYWDHLAQMIGSFVGSAYLNGSGDLVLEIDDGTMSLFGATIIRKGDTELLDARMRLVNIINQCPAHYGYNYNEGYFKQVTNLAGHADAASQGIYGVREPNEPLQLHWCRNLTNAQTMQDIIVDRFSMPIYEIEIEDKSLKRLHLDVGDYFVHSIDSLFDREGIALLNRYWRLVSVRPEFQRAAIAFRAIQTPYFMTVAYLADGTWDADGTILAGSNRDPVTY